MIRLATLSDIPNLIQMGEHFLQESPLGKYLAYNSTQMRELCQSLVDAEHGAILVAESGIGLVGMFGVIVSPHIISGEIMGTELFWWVNPEARGTAGIKLLRTAEEWAKAQGATRMMLAAPTAHVEQICIRLSYTPVESMFSKTL